MKYEKNNKKLENVGIQNKQEIGKSRKCKKVGNQKKVGNWRKQEIGKSRKSEKIGNQKKWEI